MDITKWNLEEAKKVWFEEGREEASIGIARNALAEGASLGFVQKITGLDEDIIRDIQVRL